MTHITGGITTDERTSTANVSVSVAGSVSLSFDKKRELPKNKQTFFPFPVVGERFSSGMGVLLWSASFAGMFQSFQSNPSNAAGGRPRGGRSAKKGRERVSSEERGTIRRGQENPVDVHLHMVPHIDQLRSALANERSPCIESLSGN